MADRFLEGRAAAVTGGATGIGRAIALGLLAEVLRLIDGLRPQPAPK